jgi:hypothetical protein
VSAFGHADKARNHNNTTFAIGTPARMPSHGENPIRRQIIAAENRSVAVGMNLDATGVIGRELEQRVFFTAHRDDGALALEVADGALDVIARARRIGEPLMDVTDGEQPVPALAQEVDDGLVEGAIEFRDHSSPVTGARPVPVICEL